jgi:hypothetical protein
VPYQLHCVAPLQADEATLLELGVTLEIALDDELFTELALELAIELELGAKLEDEVFTELDALVAAELLLATAEHIAPVIVGFSAATPLVSP